MTKVCTGAIENIIAKEIEKPSPKQVEYGYKFNLTLKIDGKFFSCGGRKVNKLSIKKGNDYIDLGVGDEITFVYDIKQVEDKEFFNVSGTGISLLSKGSPPAEPSFKPSFPTTVVHKPQVVHENVGVSVGHAVSNAVHLAIAKKQMTPEDIESFAKDILLISKGLRDDYENIMKPKKVKKQEVEDHDIC